MVTVYHAGRAGLAALDYMKTSRGPGYLGPGIYFTPDRRMAERYLVSPGAARSLYTARLDPARFVDAQGDDWKRIPRLAADRDLGRRWTNATVFGHYLYRYDDFDLPAPSMSPEAFISLMRRHDIAGTRGVDNGADTFAVFDASAIELVRDNPTGRRVPAPHWLYHTTYAANLERIAERGLRPNVRRALGRGGVEEHSKGRLFFGEPGEGGEGVRFWWNRYQDFAEHDSDDPIADRLVPVVLRMRGERAPTLYHDEAGSTKRSVAYYTLEPVPAEVLEVWDGDRWASLIDTVIIDPSRGEDFLPPEFRHQPWRPAGRR